MASKKKQNSFKTWTKTTMKLKDNHTWKAPPGYKVVVLERGAVSFNIPGDWIVANTDPFEMNDAPKPDDKARLTVSYWKFKPGIDWSGLPLRFLLEESSKDRDDSKIKVLERSEIFTHERTDIELMWTQHMFDDPVEHRPAYTRIAVARGFDVTLLITHDLWVDDVENLNPMWDEVLSSLQLGRVIKDPLQGEVLQ